MEQPFLLPGRVQGMSTFSAASAVPPGVASRVTPDDVPPVAFEGVTGQSSDAEFTEFVRQSGGDLARTAWFLRGDVHQAEDLTQQALVRTYLKWSTVREREPLAYARKILANLRIDHWRKRRREVLAERLPERASADGTGMLAERDRLVRALLTLPPRRRRFVVLRHLMGLREAEVADDLGVSVGTVKSTVSRSLAQLRQALEEQDLIDERTDR